MDTSDLAFSDLLRRHRRARGLTQEELAERSRLSRLAIQALEAGRRQTPREDTVQLLADALGLDDAARTHFRDAARAHRRLSTDRVADVSSSSSTNTPAPALAALATPPTRLIGRASELAQALALLRHGEGRLLTLTGPAGVGKTRLAAAIAESLHAEYPDGVIAVPLAPLRDPTLLPVTILHALGAKEWEGRPPEETLVAWLAGKQLLLLLDNAEHLVTATATLVARLLLECPHLMLLLTSRIRLKIRGERVLPLAPLVVLGPAPAPAAVVQPRDLDADAPAVTLFIERAREAAPDLVPTESDREAIAEICRRLDGLPLAIELAAVWVRLLPPSALLARLEPRLPLLTSGARDLPARQRTLRDALAWSHELLSPAERSPFRRLSVFAGGATLDAIQEVCCHDPHVKVLESLATLVDHSLLLQHETSTGEPRLSMLETIREYALERLAESGERDATERAHAHYYLTLALTGELALRGPEQVQWMEWLELEVNNLRAALRWAQDHDAKDVGLRLAGALWYFWFLSGRQNEGRGWLAALLVASPEAAQAPDVRAKAIVGASWLARSQGAFAEATALAGEGLALYERLADRGGRADALTTLVCVALDQDDPVRARPLAQESLALRREVGERWALGSSLNNVGYLAGVEGNLPEAAICFEEYLRLSRELGDTRSAALALYNLGDVARMQGDLERGKALLAEALALSRDVGWKEGTVQSVEGIARAVAAQGQTQQAAHLLAAAGTLRQAAQLPLRPAEQDEYNNVVAAMRESLGDEVFEALWAAGAALSNQQVLDEAIALAAVARPSHTSPAPAAGLRAPRRHRVDRPLPTLRADARPRTRTVETTATAHARSEPDQQATDRERSAVDQHGDVEDQTRQVSRRDMAELQQQRDDEHRVVGEKRPHLSGRVAQTRSAQGGGEVAGRAHEKRADDRRAERRQRHREDVGNLQQQRQADNRQRGAISREGDAHRRRQRPVIADREAAQPYVDGGEDESGSRAADHSSGDVGGPIL